MKKERLQYIKEKCKASGLLTGFDPCSKTKIVLKKRIARPSDDRCQRGALIELLLENAPLNCHPSAGRRHDVISIKSQKKTVGNRLRKRQSNYGRKEEGREKRPFC